MEKLITKSETTMLKGFAILMILYHHLFGRPERISMCTIIGGRIEESLLLYSALSGKIGVCIFLVLSGYGLNESIKSAKSLGGGVRISFIKANEENIAFNEVLLVCAIHMAVAPLFKWKYHLW